MENALRPEGRVPATASGAPVIEVARASWLSGRQGRRLREALLAYLFLLPAILIIGTFGLFPLLFAAYQSTLKGINQIAGRYDGLGNYISAIDSITYLVCFWGAVGLVGYALSRIVEQRRAALDGNLSFWRWMWPGLLYGLGFGLAVAMIFRFLGPFLEIPSRLRGAQATSANFRLAALEVFLLPQVQILFWGSVLLVVGAAALARFTNNRLPSHRDENQAGLFAQATIMILLAAGLLYLAWREVQGAVTAAVESGEPLDLASQLLMISGGFVLLGVSWLLWRSAAGRGNAGLALRLAGAALLMIGGWVLISELPIAVGRGDRVWWNGLLATVWYSAGTIPFQLLIALLFAVLLFQPIRGKSVFRVLYFLPYIAPFVGTAAVFRILFSSRPTAAVNEIISWVGLGPLLWLAEPRGVMQVLTGINQMPGLLAGPSLALVVIIIYSVWTFFGFNTVIFLAGLGSIPAETYEAASIDGAGRWAQFRHITMPLLSPTIYFLTLYSVIGTFKAFNHIYVLRSGAALGTTDTASVVIFQIFKRDLRYGYASALAILLLLIILTLTVINNRLAAKRVFYG